MCFTSLPESPKHMNARPNCIFSLFITPTFKFIIYNILKEWGITDGFRNSICPTRIQWGTDFDCYWFLFKWETCGSHLILWFYILFDFYVPLIYWNTQTRIYFFPCFHVNVWFPVLISSLHLSMQCMIVLMLGHLKNWLMHVMCLMLKWTLI